MYRKKHWQLNTLSWVPLQRCICPPELCSQCRAGRSSQRQCTPPGYGRLLVSPRVGAGGQQSQMREPNVKWRDSGAVDWSPTWHGQQSVCIIFHPPSLQPFFSILPPPCTHRCISLSQVPHSWGSLLLPSSFFQHWALSSPHLPPFFQNRALSSPHPLPSFNTSFTSQTWQSSTTPIPSLKGNSVTKGLT